MDEKTQLSYGTSTATGDVFDIKKGRLWVEAGAQDAVIKMKNLDARLHPGSVAMIEQNNDIYNTVYAIKGGVDIITSVGQYTLESGNRIMLAPNDILNANVKLSDKVAPIDAGIAQSTLFIRNHGESYFADAPGEGG